MWWRNIIPGLIVVLLLGLTAGAQNKPDTINTGHFNSLLEKGRFPEAIRYANGFLAQSQSIKGDNPHIYLCLAYAFWGAGQEALKYCQLVSNLPKMQFSIDCSLKRSHMVDFLPFDKIYPECVEHSSDVSNIWTSRTFKLAEALAYYRLHNDFAALRSLQDALQIIGELNDWQVRLAFIFIKAAIQYADLETDLPRLREQVHVNWRTAFDTLRHALMHPISDAEARRIVRDIMASPEKARPFGR
jgi:hypothetical protein